MKKAAFTNSFVSSAAKASAIFGVDYQRGESGTPQKRMERRWLNETAQKRAAAAGAESAVYAVASDEDGRNEDTPGSCHTAAWAATPAIC